MFKCLFNLHTQKIDEYVLNSTYFYKISPINDDYKVLFLKQQARMQQYESIYLNMIILIR